jgi:hypothetical protein
MVNFNIFLQIFDYELLNLKKSPILNSLNMKRKQVTSSSLVIPVVCQVLKGTVPVKMQNANLILFMCK